MSYNYSVSRNANRPVAGGVSVFGESPGGLAGLIQAASDRGPQIVANAAGGLGGKMAATSIINAAIQDRRLNADRALNAQLGPAEMQMKMQRRVLENLIEAIKAQARHQKRLFDTPVNVNPAPRAERPEVYQR